MHSFKLVHSFLLITFFVGIGCLAATAKPPYYIISNAETPSFGRPGLTPVGKRRAEECIPNLFSNLNIGQIITCKVDKDGEAGHECPAANATIVPLAKLLGLNITTCGTGEESNDDCVHDKIHKFNLNSNQSTLIAWGASDMDDLVENADINDNGLDEDLLGLHSDLILIINGGKTIQSSMNCTGIDGPA
ncbi:hypothetical protein E1B28_006269 [Marasmius oreades]|uniref:Uncharacterized protein n=1 Tax=Marasmius oreades TaxID=181124 RepID=A0A9P7S556_9AGAR|nr:uncharacterized protein E1B28_006269 [Marasmius oreades]KAG7095532.1 hypothetical protein E1B28_006269 [Marasmius oreades]